MDLKDEIEEFNGEELNELGKDNIFDEEEAIIEENEQDSDGDDSNNDKRFPEEEPTDWIHWFCKLRGNEYFIEIDENFIKVLSSSTRHLFSLFQRKIKIKNEENLTGINQLFIFFINK